MKKNEVRTEKKYLWSHAFQLVCIILLIVFSFLYFYAYSKPYMQKNMIDISDHWQYSVGGETTTHDMPVLQQINIPVQETLNLSRVLTDRFPNAALMLKANHQNLKIFLDDILLLDDSKKTQGTNPGMELLFVPLPEDYTGKLLQIELTSPYEAYSGAPGSIYLGEPSSLEAYAISRSILPILLMVLCLTAGFFMIILPLLRQQQAPPDWGNFFFGIFSILWGFYSTSTTFIAHEIFSPEWVSYISIGLYFLYPLPLMLYFYFQFTRCKKAFLPAVILQCAFVIIAYSLQLSSVLDFPQMLDIYNLIYVSCALYLIILGLIEMRHGNRFMRFTVPWVLLAFVISIQSLVSFYTTHIKQDETLYEMMFFILIIVVWAYNIKEFFRRRAHQKSELQALYLKNRLMVENHKNMTAHFDQIHMIRHEIRHHLAAIHILLEKKDYEKGSAYLQNLLDHQTDPSYIRYCENDLINAMLGIYFRNFEENGIRISYRISIPQELYVPFDELSSLLMNILDNAKEALDCLSNPADRWLELEIHTKKPYLYISCKNAKKNPIQKKESVYLSTKSGSMYRGYGLKLIQKIVQNHDGLLNISYTDSTFSIEVALKKTEH